MNKLELFNNAQIQKLTENKSHPEFKAGDTISVHAKIVEGDNERIQVFEGLCIAVRNKGYASSFVVRKLSHNIGVERIFPLYSPRIDKIVVVKRGRVRRAKLYYMRKLRGKSARITEMKEKHSVAE
ncbi:MAG: 50S ribosomal protein L19 [Alphaproteobacteria bacterium]|nr:50S ribosomal protein L19 [Alphaproteobacteria bacterium]